MWNWSITALCVALCAFASFKIFRQIAFLRAQVSNGCARPPRYPHKDPILGWDYWRSQKIAADNSRWLATSKALFAEHGKTYEVNNLGQRMIHTMECENIQSVWATNFEDWGLQPLREGIAEPFFGHGISTTDGEFWRQSRALVRPTFARTSAANLSFLDKHVTRLMSQLPMDGSKVDLQPLLSCLLLDASTEFLFGESMDTLLPDQHRECADFIKAFDYCIYGLGARVRLGPMRFLHHDRKWLETIKIVHDQVDRYIDRAIDSLKLSNDSGVPGQVDVEGDSHVDEKSESHADSKTERYVLLDEMVALHPDHNRHDLRSQILTVFMPGRDSTAHALVNVFHVLARRPDIYSRLRADVLRFDDAAALTFEGLKAMPYLQWVLRETLRMFPTTAQSYRMALRDTVLPRGGGRDGAAPVYVRKGDTVMASMWGLHQDPDIWGADAAEFRPERWRDLKPIWTFVPFLGGPRTCPAQQLVLTQEAFILARFVRVFSHIAPAEPQPWTEARRIGFQSKYGAQVLLTPAATMALDGQIFNAELYARLLSFWLPTYPTPSSEFATPDVMRWFAASPAVDAECRDIAAAAVSALGPEVMPLPPFESLEADRKLYDTVVLPFLPLLQKDSHAMPRAHVALALLLLVDQMPRNMYRKEAQAVVYTHYDRLARALSAHLQTIGVDREACFTASPVWRYWLHLPLEHSEAVDDHEHWGDELADMLERARMAADETGVDFIERAQAIEARHVKPLREFGRFPWRNKWLDRKSTEAEERWLREGGDRFGTG